MNEIKKSVKRAASLSFAVVLFLILLATDKGKVARSDISSTLFLIAILVLTYYTIMQWIKCVRKYVDFAIGQKMSEVYLASPATAAASAVEGKLADCRKYM